MATGKGYRLEGREIEACDCASLCPCVFGDPPEHGSCVGVLARHIAKGKIGGVNVSGLAWLEVFQSVGHQLEGETRKLVYVDRGASLDQLTALRDAFEGRLGGPLADLAKLTGEWIAVEQADVEVDVTEGEGRIAVAGKLRVVMSPRRGVDEARTTLRDAFFSTVPGSPAYVAKSKELTVVVPEHGLQFTFEGRSAVESEFRYAT
jgi:hypothetical protein